MRWRSRERESGNCSGSAHLQTGTRRNAWATTLVGRVAVWVACLLDCLFRNTRVALQEPPFRTAPINCCANGPDRRWATQPGPFYTSGPPQRRKALRARDLFREAQAAPSESLSWGLPRFAMLARQRLQGAADHGWRSEQVSPPNGQC